MIESRVSAIITAYNSEAYIAAAIRSVLNWTRAWGNFTYRQAKYAIQFAFPRWRYVWYALAAFAAYPFEMTRDKVNAVIRSITGETLYRTAKQALRTRMHPGGPR